MKILKRVSVVVLVAAIATASGYLAAQPADEDEPAVTVPMEKKADLTPVEMRRETDNLIAQMQEVLTRVVEIQQVARKQKDVIKLNCVNDKLLQIKQLLNIADDANTDLVEAIASQDEDARYHEFGQVKIAYEKTFVLRDEAEGCVGEELVFLGPTQIDVDRPDIPDDPTDDDPFDEGIRPDNPAYVSPFN